MAKVVFLTRRKSFTKVGVDNRRLLSGSAVRVYMWLSSCQHHIFERDGNGQFQWSKAVVK